MKRRMSPNALRPAVRNGPVIAFSITNQSGKHYDCRAQVVTLQFTGGVVQMFQGTQGCFMGFDRCRIELRDGYRNVAYQLLAGAASKSGHDLTIVAEFEGDIRGLTNPRFTPDRPRPKTPPRAVIQGREAGGRAHHT